MEWPQILMVILLTVKVTAGLYLHDNTKKISFWSAISNAAVIAVILYAGGFWG